MADSFTRTVRGRLVGADRLKNTKDGNPRWVLTLHHEAGATVGATVPDGQVGHLVSNATVGKTVEIEINTTTNWITAIKEID